MISLHQQPHSSSLAQGYTASSPIACGWRVSTARGVPFARNKPAWPVEASQSACSGKNGSFGDRAETITSLPRSPDHLTHVQLIWVEKQIQHWIRFGRPLSEQILDRRRSLVSFAPFSVFAFVRWKANEYGTISSQVDILRAVAAGEPFTTLPFVDPGGELLLHLFGWPKVERVLQTIDSVEAIGINAADAAPDYWRHVHNRLTAGATPRPYTHSRHTAWLLRRRLLP